MSNKKGEIATILTISSLVFLGAVSLISSMFLGRISTTKTKASEDCNQMANRSCVNYAPNTQTNKQKKDVTGVCNPACCECDEQCPNGQKCDIPNGYCQSGFSCNPLTQKKLTCVLGKCVWQPCQGDDCNRNTCTSDTQCQNQLVSPTPTSTPTDGCFNIKADIEVRPEGDKKAFYVWVNFNSSKGGDIKLEYNGIHVAGWNRFGGGNFTYSPQWTQPHTHDHEAGIAALANGQSIQFTYRGMHSSCTPQDVTISCSAGVSQDGNTWVSGTNCQCHNCNKTSTPTPTLTNLCAWRRDCYVGYNCTGLGARCEGWYCCLPGQVTPTPTKPPTSIRTQTPTPTKPPTSDPYCHYLNLSECVRKGNCQGNCERCNNGRYKCISEIKPTQTPASTRIPTPTSAPTSTPTSIPTPTSLLSLPDKEDVLNRKGTISFFIPFINNQYYGDFDNFYKLDSYYGDIIDLLLHRKTNCYIFNGWLTGCTYDESVRIDPIGISIVYNNIDRYYSDYGALKPNIFYFSAYYLTNEYEKNFSFGGYYDDRLSFNDLPPIDLAKYYRKFSVRFSKQDGYLYQEGDSIEMWVDPLPINNDKIKKVSFDNNIDIIYIAFFNPLPSNVNIIVEYNCGDNRRSSAITKIIRIPKEGQADSTENEIGEITLECSINNN